jgi:hypothetical protein
MQEARASFNGYFRSPTGNKDQFTLRQSDEQSDKEFILRVKNFTKLLREQGWVEWGEQPEAAVPAEQPEAAERSGRSFEVERIQLAAGGDHPRWVVKGGNFKKFGVTCWPEVLQAAGLTELLDPLKENKPRGRWLAKYVERENDEGRWVPDKVTELLKAAA